MSSMLKPNVRGAAPLMNLVVSAISPARNSIQQTMISPASQYLARLIRPSKRNRYRVQSIAASGRQEQPTVRKVGRLKPAWVRLIPQQLVDAGFGPGSLVDPLDDHGAGGGGAGLAVLQRPRGQGAGYHHGVFRHLADKGLPGIAVDDLGRGAEEHAHRQHRALAHDHALGDFR